MMWWQVFWWAVTLILSEMLRPKPQVDNAKPAGLSDFQFPTASDSRPVPIVWGTAWISGPNVVDYGDLQIVPITRRVKTGLKSHTDQIIGYRYFMMMQIALCYKADALLEIKAEQDKVAWTGSAMDTKIIISQPNLFGGDDGEGGLGAFQTWTVVIGGGGTEQMGPGGEVYIYSGKPTQQQDPYLASLHGSQVPAYRGVTTLVFKQFYMGNSQYIKQLSFKVKYLPKALGSGYHDINGNANPAEMLYELFTDYQVLAGFPAALVDTTSFLNAAQRLYTEGFGLAAVFDNPSEALDIAGEILRTIDGTIYTDLSTGKLCLRLIRDDYDPANLPIYDESNIVELVNFGRSALDETVNEVRVTYHDQSEDKDLTAYAPDLGNWDMQGDSISVTKRYDCCPTADLAGKLAYRDMRVLSYPLAKVTLRLNRQAYAMKPGDLFNFSWSRLGISQMVMRAAKIGYGTLESGTITVDAVEDIFTLSSSVYSNSGSLWTDPRTPPTDPTYVHIEEANYLQRMQLGASSDCIPLACVARPSAGAYDYQLWISPSGNPYEYQGAGLFTPRGVLAAAVGPLDSTIVLQANGIDLGRLAPPPTGQQDQGSTLFTLGNELCCYNTVAQNTDGTVTLGGVWRGLLDTVPQTHSVGEECWFIAYACGKPGQTYDVNEAIAVKSLPRTPLGTLDISNATAHNTSLAGRADCLYPPGCFRIQGLAYPTTISGECGVISWAHRDRTAQTAYLIQESAGNIGPETGTIYRLQIYGRNGGTWALKHTEDNMTGTSYTYSEATEKSENGGAFNQALRFVLRGYKAGPPVVNNWQDIDWTVTRV
jgi:hypothetical protein